MKTTIVLLAAIFALLTPVQSAEKVNVNFDRNKAITNLLFNLSSENKGVRESSAFMLGELQSHEGIIPLMAVLHNDTNESSRIVAALSLCKIGGGRGMYAVKQAVRFDESQRVRLTCAWFTNMYSGPQQFEFIPMEKVQSNDITENINN